MARVWGTEFDRTDLLRRVGDMSQLAQATPFELTEGNERGCRGVRLANGTGISATVLTDRGMALTDVTSSGVPVAYKTPVGAVHPAFCTDRGLDWLRTWPGGFCTPCGMTQVGAPCTDGDEELGLHGRAAATPAKQVSYGGAWIDERRYEVWVEGKLRETAVFAENIVLTRRVTARLGEPFIVIEDRYVNEGFEPAPHMVLQHFNLGFPLIAPETRLILPPGSTEPRDERAREGLQQCCAFAAPQDSFDEQVFYHDLEPDREGYIRLAVVNQAFDSGRGLAVGFRYRWSEYPNLVEWKMMKAGTYALGIEPANCLVGGRQAERRAGTLQTLEPGQARTYRIETAVLTGGDVAELVTELDSVEYTKK